MMTRSESWNKIYFSFYKNTGLKQAIKLISKKALESFWGKYNSPEALFTSAHMPLLEFLNWNHMANWIRYGFKLSLSNTYHVTSSILPVRVCSHLTGLVLETHSETYEFCRCHHCVSISILPCMWAHLITHSGLVILWDLPQWMYWIIFFLFT